MWLSWMPKKFRVKCGLEKVFRATSKFGDVPEDSINSASAAGSSANSKSSVIQALLNSAKGTLRSFRKDEPGSERAIRKSARSMMLPPLATLKFNVPAPGDDRDTPTSTRSDDDSQKWSGSGHFKGLALSDTGKEEQVRPPEKGGE